MAIEHDDLGLAAEKWAQGRKQKDLLMELWAMMIHTIGTLQTLLDHLGLTEITAIPNLTPNSSTGNSAAASADGIAGASLEESKGDARIT